MAEVSEARRPFVESPTGPPPPQDNFRLSDVEDMPRVPVGATEDLRAELAQKGRDDLYFLCKGVLGYSLLTRRTHLHLCRFVQTSPSLRRMIQMPRGHFKTTIATIAHSIQLIIQNPELRILLVASSSTNAERFLREIKNHFRRNQRFRWLYPELIPDDWSKVRSNAQEFEVPRRSFSRDPTYDTIGARGAVESRHYHVIKADDIIGKKEFDSDSEMEKTCEWSDGLESLLVNPLTDQIDYIGTRWKMSDVYAHQQRYYGAGREEKPAGTFATKQGKLHIFCRGAREDGKVIFPEMIDDEFLDNLLRMNPERYAAQYANNPAEASITLFRPEWRKDLKLVGSEHQGVVLREPEEDIIAGRIRDWELIVLVDPAVGKETTKKPCLNAMLLTGTKIIDNLLRIAVFDWHVGKYPIDEMVDKIFEWDLEYAPEFFSVERYGFQSALKFWIDERAEHTSVAYPPIQEYPRKGSPNAQKAKDARIKGLQPLFRWGQVYVPEHFTEFNEEYTFYPNSQFRDVLDALAQGLEWWEHSEDAEEEAEWDEMERKLIASIGPDGYSRRKLVASA